MRQNLTCLVFAVLWPVYGPAFAQTCVPPVNETCAGAIVFTNANLPYTYMGPLGCVNNIVDKPYFDVFFRFDCTCTGMYTLDMCDSPGDEYLRIYTGACGWSGGTEYAVADDECPSSPPNADPRITVQLNAGTTYWIELGPWRPDPPWAPPLNSIYTFHVSLCIRPADVNADGFVNIDDMLMVINGWGPCINCGPVNCPADVTGNCTVDIDDLLAVINQWS